MITGLQLVILILATFRVVRLVIEDVVIEPIRERTVYKLHPDNKVRELFECAWCLGFWLSILVVIAYALWPVGTTWAALPFAISAGVGLIAANSR